MPPLRLTLADLPYAALYAAAAASAWSASWPGAPWPQLALAWVLLEAAFFLYGKWRLSCLGQLAKELPRSDQHELVWERFVELSQVRRHY